MTITFIGGGNMATALIGGLVARGRPERDFRVVEPSAEQRRRLAARFPAAVLLPATDAGAVAGSALVVLAVKPQSMREAALALAPHLAAASGLAILTIAAGIRRADLAHWLGSPVPIIRAMPNTPALIGKGITGLYAAPDVAADELALAAEVLEAAGEVIRVDRESMLDAITGVSGSGPAYVFYFLEACEEAARDLGFAGADARRLAYATFSGAIALAQASAEAPAVLRAQVTSKGGTTERGIAAMDAAGVKAAIVAGVKAAAQRAQELGDAFGSGA
jgi:pyrroline-5-carboxylate reductase